LPELHGFCHIEFTVRDANASVAWYERVLGFSVRGEYHPPHAQLIVMEHRSGMILGFWRHEQTPGSDRFDEFQTGLDHIAFRVSTRNEIDDWAAHFKSLGVDYSEPVDVGSHGVVLTFRDPDNIQLEVHYQSPPHAPYDHLTA
jgi:catechol 2,3-dioxygenase-like lactoylglutathione lyase family enzyme